MSRAPYRLSSALASALLIAVLARGAMGVSRTADRVWIRPDAARFPVTRIAVLPVVAEDVHAGRAVEEQWLLQFIADGHDWLPSEVCGQTMRALSPRRPDSTARAIENQVFHAELPDTTGVPPLARALAAQAILTLKVKRWERVVEADPTITTAYVELAAALVDSAGHVLWRISGEQRQLSKYGIPQVVRGEGAIGGTIVEPTIQGGAMSSSGQLISAPTVLGVVGVKGGVTYQTNAAGNTGELAPDFEAALTKLYERWQAVYPLRRRAGR